MRDRVQVAVGLIQMNSGADLNANLDQARQLGQSAVLQGANWLVYPETVLLRNAGKVKPIAYQRAVAFFAALAVEWGVWIVAGTVFEACVDTPKGYNTCAVIDPSGILHAEYRKIHLFDQTVHTRAIRESDQYLPGERPVLVDIMHQLMGLTVCYDLRFPELFRYYASKGATVVCVPSAFTRPTGEKHWEILLRARAIENQLFILAPNQTGVGAGGILSYGNSLIIGPDGEILARGTQDSPGVTMAILDFTGQAELRNRFPVLKHRRFFQDTQ